MRLGRGSPQALGGALCRGKPPCRGEPWCIALVVGVILRRLLAAVADAFRRSSLRGRLLADGLVGGDDEGRKSRVLRALALLKYLAYACGPVRGHLSFRACRLGLPFLDGWRCFLFTGLLRRGAWTAIGSLALLRSHLLVSILRKGLSCHRTAYGVGK